MEIVKREYLVSYLQKPLNESPAKRSYTPKESTWQWQSSNFLVGSVATKPTNLHGLELVSWLYEIIVEITDTKKEEIVILAISEIGSLVFQE